MGLNRSLTRAALRRVADALLLETPAIAAFEEELHGYDAFGANSDGAALGLQLTRFLYDRYFRVRSEGIENIPAEGPVIVVANHSGQLPLDAMMLYTDMLRRLRPVRLPRPVADHFVSSLPFANTFFARTGVVGGSRRNVEYLLERGELLLLFPEGVPGISKPFSERYRLQRWREGHVELAQRFGATIVPACVVGAEEQWPSFGKLPLGKLGRKVLGAPFLPLLATPMPLPVRYHLRYGAPLFFEADKALSLDPRRVAEGAEVVRDAVQTLLDETLAARRGVFR